MIGAILTVLIGFLVIVFLLWLLKNAIEKPCKFFKKCPYYNKDDIVCNSDGDYYGPGRKAGCYIQMMEKEKK